MKKLFVQFYLLLFVCFLVMTLLVGLVYKFTAERAGRQSLDDLMKSSLYLMRSELREIPPREWGKTLKEMDLNLSFDLRVEPLNHYKLDAATTQRLREGDIVALDDQYTLFSVSRAAITSWRLARFPTSIPASNATAGYRLNGAHCLFSRLSCVYLDAPALARNAQARIRRAALWRGSFD